MKKFPEIMLFCFSSLWPGGDQFSLMGGSMGAPPPSHGFFLTPPPSHQNPFLLTMGRPPSLEMKSPAPPPSLHRKMKFLPENDSYKKYPKNRKLPFDKNSTNARFSLWEHSKFHKKVKQFVRNYYISWWINLVNKFNDVEKFLISFHAMCY